MFDWILHPHLPPDLRPLSYLIGVGIAVSHGYRTRERGGICGYVIVPLYDVSRK